MKMFLFFAAGVVLGLAVGFHFWHGWHGTVSCENGEARIDCWGDQSPAVWCDAEGHPNVKCLKIVTEYR